MPERSTEPPRVREATGAELTPEATMADAAELAIDDLAIDLASGAAEAEAEVKRLSAVAWLAIGWMALIVVAAVFAQWLPIDDPAQINVDCLREGPSASHWLGCDTIGRDLLARNIHGAQSSLFVAVGSIVIGFVVGGGLGLIAGYYRGRIDTILTGTFDTLLAFPQLVLALTLVAVFASGDDISSFRRLLVLILALGIVSIPIVARISRANTLAWAQREFVTAARAQGAKNGRIIWREVLPNVLPAMFSISLLGIAVVIVAEGGLSVLGVGVQLPRPSWGNIIALGVESLEDTPHIVFGASAFIFVTVLALNYLGDVVRERFDVRESAL